MLMMTCVKRRLQPQTKSFARKKSNHEVDPEVDWVPEAQEHVVVSWAKKK